MSIVLNYGQPIPAFRLTHSGVKPETDASLRNIIPGIMPVINATQIRRMVTMCGASFPVRFQKIIHKYEDNKEALFDAGMSYALSQIIDLLESDIDGIHLYSMNNPLVARKICEGIRHII